MTVARDRSDADSERSFAILMIVLSVLIFLAILYSERSRPE